MGFLQLPPEIRIVVYEFYLEGQRYVESHQQPRNNHIRTLLVCKTVYYEAGPLFRSYVSLRNERQIDRLLRDAASFDFSHVIWADVANDGRSIVATVKNTKVRIDFQQVSGEGLTGARQQLPYLACM